MGSPSAKDVFVDAMELPEPERAAFVARACGGDTALHQRVVALLRAHAAGAGFMASPTADEVPVPATGPGEGPGTRIGPYRLLERIGEGGFGAVFMAEQKEPLDRRVALKILKPGMDTHQVVARFEQERQALALMDHPHIARVIDAGATDSGRPYFVMELVKGEPIAQYCDKHRLRIDERLELFAQVCSAVQHGHQKGIIHRDLKPSNILVTTHDGRPHARVIDFGIAKATASRLTGKTLFTEHRQLIGTPEYMSPEQAEGSLDIDTRTDVYSLGVLLYELLTGSTPFDAQSLREAGYGEILRIIREEEPPRPSTRLRQSSDRVASLAALRHTEPGRLGALMRGELDWIVMKALEKDRQRRYGTASDLAADIRHYLGGEPVAAVPPSAGYRFAKFLRRHRAPVLGAGAVLLALLAGLVGTFWQARVAAEERDAARAAETEQRRLTAAEARQRAAAEAIESFVTRALNASDPGQGGAQDMRVTEAMARAVQWLDDGAFKDQPETAARLRLTIAGILRSNGKGGDALPLARRALVILQQQQPPDDQWIAHGLETVVRVLHDLGRNHEAEPLAAECLELQRRIHPGDNQWVASSLDALGMVLLALGRGSEADTLLTQALEMAERDPEHEPAALCTRRFNLGNVKHTLGNSAAAEVLLAKALEGFRRLYPGDHPEKAACISGLAVVRSELGRPGEARALDEEALAMSRRLYHGEHPRVAIQLANLGATYRKLGRLDLAETQLVQALAMHRRVYPGDHPATAGLLGNLARVREDLGRPAEAEPLMVEVLQMQERMHPGDHPDVALTLGALGMVRVHLGRPAEAEPHLVRSRDMLLRLFPGGHLQLARAVDRLARVRAELGDAAGAEALFLQVLEMFQKIHGADHVDQAAALTALAQVLAGAQRHAEAVERLEQSIAMYRRLGLDGDRNLATALVGLANLQQILGRGAEAEANAQAAVAIQRRLWPDGHPSLATALRMLAGVRRAQGRVAEAEPLLVQALAMLSRAYPDEHPQVTAVRAELGAARVHLGQLDNAEPLLVGALAVLERTPESDPVLLLNTLSALGDLRLAQGHPEQAEPLLRAALERLRTRDPAPGQKLQQVLHNLASALRALGRVSEARTLYREALATLRTLHPGDHPDVARCLHSLGELEASQGRAAVAAALLADALAMRQRLFPDGHDDVATSLRSLAKVELQQGRTAEAERHLVESVELLERLHPGAESRDFAHLLNSLGSLYWSSGRAAKAEPLFARALTMLEPLVAGDDGLKVILLLNLGAARAALGRVEQAAADYSRGIEMNDRLVAACTDAVPMDLRENAVGLRTNLALLKLKANQTAAAVPLLTTVIELREQIPTSDPEESARLQEILAQALESLGRGVEALACRRARLARVRDRLPDDSATWSHELAAFGNKLIEAGTREALAEAEPLLRECLKIREVRFPASHAETWFRHSAMSLLGAALAGLGRFAEAEPLLLTAQAGLADDPRVPPPSRTGGNSIQRQAIERVARLYEAWHAAAPDPARAAKAAQWRARVPAAEAGAK